MTAESYNAETLRQLSMIAGDGASRMYAAIPPAFVSMFASKFQQYVSAGRATKSADYAPAALAVLIFKKARG
jgi:hypothetical protein